MKYVVVGAGITGSVIAERIANELKEEVLVIDKRNHIGGNCYSYTDKETGIECHKYGSHIFHTSNENVWKYINKFTSFNNYQHHVWTTYKNRVYSLPINLNTINSYYNKNLSPNEAEEFIKNEAKKENLLNPKNLEEKAISLIGRPLYEAFIKGYTEKQWEKEPKVLSADIITRLPVRYNYNNRYFSDLYEGIPVEGYTKIFENMLDNSLIEIKLNTSFEMIRNQLPKDVFIVYTGPIDQYYGYKFGKLEWRTVDFEIEKYDIVDYQGTSVMNYAEAEIPYTRIHEFKHFHPEIKYQDKTIIYKEFSHKTADDEPYYPIKTENNLEILNKYQELAKEEKNVFFGGRLGLYKYFDIDDAIEDALNAFDKIKLTAN